MYDLVVNGDFTSKLWPRRSTLKRTTPLPPSSWTPRAHRSHRDELGNIWGSLDMAGFGTKIFDAVKDAGGDLIEGIKTGIDTGKWQPLGESIEVFSPGIRAR